MQIADSLTVEGALTATGGISGGGNITSPTISGPTIGGPVKDVITAVAAAGATLGTATAIPSTAYIVYATVTSSTEGVKLPTAATNLVLVVMATPTIGVKIYAAAAGQKIGTATTAATAYALVKNTTTTFRAVNTTQWLVQKGS